MNIGWRVRGARVRFDPSAVLLSMPIDEARDAASRVASTWSAEAGEGLDLHAWEMLRRALAQECPHFAPAQIAALTAAVADSARALAASRWRALGMGRPENPVVDSFSIRGALLLHLHGHPDGPVSEFLRQHHEEGQLLQSPRRPWRSPPPTREQVERFARALRAHEEALSAYLASLEGNQ